MKPFHFIAIIVITILTSTFVWVRLQIVGVSYAIHDLQEKEKEIREQNSSISSKIHQARSPFQLDKLSREKFHMSAPRTDQIIVMKDVSNKDTMKKQ